MLHKPMTWVFAMRERSADSSRFFSRFAPFLARFARSGRTAPPQRQQLLFGQHQIRQTKQAEQLRCVLDQALVANHAMTKQIFYDVERMLDPRPNPGLGSLDAESRTPVSSCAVMKITGMPLPASRRCTSSPFRPGIWISSTRQSGRYAGMESNMSRNSSPVLNVSADSPTERRSRLMARRTDSSSSTTATNGLTLLMATFPIHRRRSTQPDSTLG